jgi:hypothetical protein
LQVVTDEDRAENGWEGLRLLENLPMLPLHIF